MTKKELDRLKKIQKVAPQESWDYYLETGMEGHGVIVTYEDLGYGYKSLKGQALQTLVCSEELKLYIATFNPIQVKDLLKEIENLKRQNKVLRWRASYRGAIGEK